jgi:GDP-D-mannose dehydratase
MKRALTTGIAGQDGSYLVEQLLDEGEIDPRCHRPEIVSA